MLKQILWFLGTWLALTAVLVFISLKFWGFVDWRAAGIAFVGAIFWRAMDLRQARKRGSAT